MSDRPASYESAEIPAELARLRNAISCELYAQLALRQETIKQVDVPGVAYAVAVQLSHAFRIEPTPLWEYDRQDDESLGPDAATFYGSAAPYGDARSPDRYPIFDHGWPSRT
jgi:hypothetical protein